VFNPITVFVPADCYITPTLALYFILSDISLNYWKNIGSYVSFHYSGNPSVAPAYLLKPSYDDSADNYSVVLGLKNITLNPYIPIFVLAPVKAF